ncbi:MAG: hypothetical protein PVG81_10110 [Desulfobacterales bacterium]|jgi:hypothetical protein
MDFFKNGLNVGTMAIGAGIILAAPVVVPLVGKALRPVAKTLIKGGMAAYRETEKAIGQVGVSMKTMVKEARAELK